MVKLLELENGVRSNKKTKKIEVYNPYFMRRGWTKASEYFTIGNNEE